MNIQTIIAALATLATLALLSGCGRAGAPLKPSASAAKQAKANNLPIPAKPVPNSTNSGKRFILDGLLE